MLSENSDREKITVTIKKDNKLILEQIANAENRNISRQLDYLIETFYSHAEQEICMLLDEAQDSVTSEQDWLTSKELKERLGLSNVQDKI